MQKNQKIKTQLKPFGEKDRKDRYIERVEIEISKRQALSSIGSPFDLFLFLTSPIGSFGPRK
jgi:hypothetical protein